MDALHRANAHSRRWCSFCISKILAPFVVSRMPLFLKICCCFLSYTDADTQTDSRSLARSHTHVCARVCVCVCRGDFLGSDGQTSKRFCGITRTNDDEYDVNVTWADTQCSRRLQQPKSHRQSASASGSAVAAAAAAATATPTAGPLLAAQ